MVDSDLDWGQNIIRLARRLKELNASQVAFTDFNLRPQHLMFWPGLPPVQEINPLRPSEALERGQSQPLDAAAVRPELSRSARAAVVCLLPAGGEGGHAVALTICASGSLQRNPLGQ